MRIAAALALAMSTGLAAVTVPAQAEVVGRTDQSFAVKFTAEVAASVEDSWSAMIAPSTWWLSDHTYSGDASNLSLDANAGGCFCERLPASADHPSEGPRGSVEHMRVIYAEHPRALRLSGALGPLQSEAVQGVMTVTFTPLEGGGTRILWDYAVGGFMRFKTEQMAPLLDKILGEQFDALVRKLGPRAPNATGTVQPGTGTGPAEPPPAAGPPTNDAQPVEPGPDGPQPAPPPPEPPPPSPPVDPLGDGR